MEAESATIKSIILEYYENDLTYKDMSCLLQKKHGYILSENAIRKRIKHYGCPQRRGPTLHNLTDIKLALELELKKQPVTVGYRQMTNVLRHKGYHVRRDTVMEVMKQMDPDGVAFRRRRRIRRKVYTSIGPNYVWHIDGYDKLKPYGFAIHGCIDGYSRRIMWLKVSHTNNNPRCVATNFVQCVNSVKGIPVILQADPGTENSVLGAIQCTFRQSHEDCFAGSKSFRVVRSVFNQRIEAWWSMFRRHKSQWWLEYFKDLEMFGAFTRGNELEILCLRYSFMPLIQQELDDLVHQWNNHYIANSRDAHCPGGRPNVLYTLPENSGADDCICRVSEEDLAWALSNCVFTTISGSKEFDDFAASEYASHNIQEAINADEALRQYFYLCEVTRQQDH